MHFAHFSQHAILPFLSGQSRLIDFHCKKEMTWQRKQVLCQAAPFFLKCFKTEALQDITKSIAFIIR